MKAKVKETKKDINIDIIIENNVLSKNKMIPSNGDDEKKTNKPNSGGGSGGNNLQSINNNASRLLGEYYGIMAQRDLYRQSTPPFNLQQFINPQRNNPMITGNTPTTNIDGGIVEEPNSVVAQNEESILPDPEEDNEEDNDVTVIEKGFEMLNKSQETAYLATLNAAARSNRKQTIDRIKNGRNVREQTIKSWKLGKYVKKYNQALWDQLTAAEG